MQYDDLHFEHVEFEIILELTNDILIVQVKCMNYEVRWKVQREGN